ncbi:hypothetical protein [Methanobrevibacter sp.]
MFARGRSQTAPTTQNPHQFLGGDKLIYCGQSRMPVPTTWNLIV